eukprot:TRINITY_DN24328_c0_g1_i4.p1 TRINITY_DN24328_c0_g1~~TRINITY_DN24328_c0_g1_i4.p1  ORF type:complete len:134 (-),score=28.80 TRINITY_DN24328_c0_g1_i4:26-427(-)
MRVRVRVTTGVRTEGVGDGAEKLLTNRMAIERMREALEAADVVSQRTGPSGTKERLRTSSAVEQQRSLTQPSFAGEYRNYCRRADPTMTDLVGQLIRIGAGSGSHDHRLARARWVAQRFLEQADITARATTLI